MATPIVVMTLAGCVAALALGVLWGTAFSRHTFSRQFAITLMLMLIGAYAVVAFYLEPPVVWDLWRHYDELDRMRIGSESYREDGSRYADLPGSSLLFLLVSATPFNGLLVVIAVAVSGLALLAQLRVAYKGEGIIPARELALIVSMFLAYSNVVFTVSGVRNSMAVAIVAIGYSLEISHRRSRILPWVFYLGAALFHPAAFVLVIIRGIVFLPAWWLRVPAALISLVGYEPLAELLSNSGVSFFRSIGMQMTAYVEDEFVVDLRLVALNAIVVVCLLLYRMVPGGKAGADRFRMEFVSRYEVTLYTFMLAAAVVIPLMFNRTLYAFGYFLVPLVLGAMREKKSAGVTVWVLWIGAAINIAYQILEFRGAFFLGGAQ